MLYGRVGKRLQLTAEGQRLEAFAREILERLAELPAELAAVEPEEQVVLCGGEGAFLYVLGEGLKRFRRRRAGTWLRLKTGDREATIDEVTAGRAHLGVTVFDGQPSAALSGTVTDPIPSAFDLAEWRHVTASPLRHDSAWGRPARGSFP